MPLRHGSATVRAGPGTGVGSLLHIAIDGRVDHHRCAAGGRLPHRLESRRAGRQIPATSRYLIIVATRMVTPHASPTATDIVTASTVASPLHTPAPPTNVVQASFWRATGS